MSGQMQERGERAFAPGHSSGRGGAARFAATSSLTGGRFGARLFSPFGRRVVLRQSDVVILFAAAALLGLWFGTGPL